MVQRVRARIGRQRIGGSVRPSEASYTRSIRSQMDTILENFNRVVNGLEEISADGLEYALRPTFEKSQELVPVDTGDLKNSGYLEVRRTARGVAAEIGYSKGGNPHYGPFVHETLEFYHEPPTQAKFLEQPLIEDRDEIVKRYLQFMKNNGGFDG